VAVEEEVGNGDVGEEGETEVAVTEEMGNGDAVETGDKEDDAEKMEDEEAEEALVDEDWPSEV
jgi:hypothetical protein